MSRGRAATTHAVIDGSNLATEGRKEPSLAQLDEAVRAIIEEFRFGAVTVIVDATFEHRVAKSETKAARKAIDEGDIITPPAGVIGRGDAFILQVADRAKAVVFSNDSFQEFHGTYKWLFDEGRLVGGKPVPGVGWIYVARSPVRGPVSRRATAGTRRAKPKPDAKTEAKAEVTPTTVAPEREPSITPEKPARKRRSSRASSAAGTSGDGSNDPSAWKTFTRDYPVGSTVAVQVDRFSSHGAYGSVDDVVIYLPNRLLGDPAPTKARDVISLGATIDFVIHRFDEERFGIDAGLVPAPEAPSARTDSSKASATATKKAPARKVPAKKAPAKRASAKKARATASARKTPAKRTTAKKAPAKKATTKKAAPRKAPAKKAPAKKATTKKAAPRKAPAKNAPAKKASRRR